MLRSNKPPRTWKCVVLNEVLMFPRIINRCVASKNTLNPLIEVATFTDENAWNNITVVNTIIAQPSVLESSKYSALADWPIVHWVSNCLCCFFFFIFSKGLQLECNTRASFVSQRITGRSSRLHAVKLNYESGNLRQLLIYLIAHKMIKTCWVGVGSSFREVSAPFCNFLLLNMWQLQLLCWTPVWLNGLSFIKMTQPTATYTSNREQT